MKRYELKMEGRVLILTETFGGKLRAATLRTVSVLPWIFGALGLLFTIDYVGGDKSVPLGIYVSAVFGLALAVSLGVGLGRILRHDLWAVDPGERVVAFESRLPWGQYRSSAVDFKDIDRVTWNKKAASLVLTIGDREEVLCESSPREVEEFALALKKIIKDTRIKFTQNT